MKKRLIDIKCVQETKWGNLSDKSRYLDLKTKEFKLFYHGINNQRNGVGIIILSKYINNIVNIKKVSDRLIVVKLVINKEIWNVVCAYAPQIVLEMSEKISFWNDFEMLMQEIPPTPNELVVIGADMNGHVGEKNNGFAECHGGFGYGSMNDEGEEVLDFAKAYGLTLLNTMFEKQKKHLITYNNTQIDYILCSNDMKKSAKSIPKPKPKPVEKVKWINLEKKNGEVFIDEIKNWLQDCIDAADELTTDYG